MRTRTLATRRAAAARPRASPPAATAARPAPRRRRPRQHGVGGKAAAPPVAGDAARRPRRRQEAAERRQHHPGGQRRRRRADALLAALDKVSAALDTDKLIALNKAVDVDRKTSPNVAKEFVEAEGLRRRADRRHAARSSSAPPNFTESRPWRTLHEVLNAAGFDATVKQIGNRELYEPALEKGEHPRRPGVRGTLTEFLNKARTAPTPSRRQQRPRRDGRGPEAASARRPA